MLRDQPEVLRISARRLQAHRLLRPQCHLQEEGQCEFKWWYWRPSDVIVGWSLWSSQNIPFSGWQVRTVLAVRMQQGVVWWVGQWMSLKMQIKYKHKLYKFKIRQRNPMYGRQRHPQRYAGSASWGRSIFQNHWITWYEIGIGRWPWPWLRDSTRKHLLRTSSTMGWDLWYDADNNDDGGGTHGPGVQLFCICNEKYFKKIIHKRILF